MKPRIRFKQRWHKLKQRWIRFNQRWRKRLFIAGSFLVRAAIYPFRLFTDLCRMTVQAAILWWSNRTKRLLIQGLPALLVAVAAVGLMVTLAQAEPNRTEADYQAHARQSLQTGKYEDAATSYERLILISPEQEEYRFGSARAAEALEHLDQATAIISELASENRSGYGPAHLWLARRLFQQPAASTDRNLSIERHLLRALEKQPGMTEANVLLAQLYVNTRRLAQAEPYLLRAIEARPDLRLALARLYRSLGRTREADFQARTALEYFRQKTRAEVDNQFARLRWSEAAVQLGDFPQAINVLQEGLVLSQAIVFRQALAEVFGVWSDRLADGTMSQFGNRLALIEQGLSYDASNPGLLERLLALTKPPKSDATSLLGTSVVGFGAAPLASAPLSVLGPAYLLANRAGDPGQARAALHNLLLRGQVPAVTYFALGLDAWEQGKFSEARKYWEQAYQQAPEMGVIGNNLAWMLATVEPVDLPRALQLINPIVERFPDQAGFRGTRGHVLARMKRWKEALPDLVASLKAFPDNTDTHAALAEAYSQLGFTDLAASHRKLAQKKE
jgi:tetratricopeptide (TPR) repeat protein